MSMELKPGWQSTNHKSEVLSTALWAPRYILNIVGKLQNQVAYHVNENMFEIHDLSKREPKAFRKKKHDLLQIEYRVCRPDSGGK